MSNVSKQIGHFKFLICLGWLGNVLKVYNDADDNGDDDDDGSDYDDVFIYLIKMHRKFYDS